MLNRRSLEVVRRSVADLAHPDELRELGLGIFLDRPLSAGKAPGEPDSTPLLASLAFSRSIAVQRVNALAKDELFMFEKPVLDKALRTLLDSPPRGLPLDRIGGAVPARSGEPERRTFGRAGLRISGNPAIESGGTLHALRLVRPAVGGLSPLRA